MPTTPTLSPSERRANIERALQGATRLSEGTTATGTTSSGGSYRQTGTSSGTVTETAEQVRAREMNERAAETFKKQGYTASTPSSGTQILSKTVNGVTTIKEIDIDTGRTRKFLQGGSESTKWYPENVRAIPLPTASTGDSTTPNPPPTYTVPAQSSMPRADYVPPSQLTYEQLSPEQRRMLLGMGTPEYTLNYLNQRSYNPLPDYYKSTQPQQPQKQSPRFNSFWGMIGTYTGESIKMYMQPFTWAMKQTGFEEKSRALLEYAGQGIGFGVEAQKEALYGPIKQLIATKGYDTTFSQGYQAKYATTRTDLGMANIPISTPFSDKPFKFTYQRQTIQDIANKDYTRWGINYALAVDTAVAFTFPLEKSIYEVSKPTSTLSTPEKIGAVAMGALWAGGTKITTFALERTLGSKALQSAVDIAPKAGKLATYSLKTVKGGVQYGLPAIYIGSTFLKVNAMPTVEMQRLESKRSSESMAYMTFGAFPAGYVTGKTLQIADALSRIYKFSFKEGLQKTADFIPLNRIVREAVIKGTVNFPTSGGATTGERAKIQYNLFVGDKRYRLPMETEAAGYHATIEQLPKSAKLTTGSSEATGFYLSTEASIYFLKLRGEGDAKVFSFGDTTLSPTIIRQTVKGFSYIPRSFKATMGSEQLQALAPKFTFRPDYNRINEFLMTKAEKGVGYISGKKSEIEAVIPTGTETVSRGIPYYTKVPSIAKSQQYEFFFRKGKQEAIIRAKSFKWYNPMTYFDKIVGYKGGQIKSFGIKKGQIVPIEYRDIAGDTGTPAKSVYSFGGGKGGTNELYPYGRLSILTGSSISAGLLSYVAPRNVYASNDFIAPSRVSSSIVSSRLSSSVLSSGVSSSRMSSSVLSSGISSRVSSSVISSGVSSSVLSSGVSSSRVSSSILSSGVSSSVVSSGVSSSVLSSTVSSVVSSRVSKTSSITSRQFPSFMFGFNKPLPEKRKRKGRQKYVPYPTFMSLDLKLFGEIPSNLTGLENRRIDKRFRKQFEQVM